MVLCVFVRGGACDSFHSVVSFHPGGTTEWNLPGHIFCWLCEGGVLGVAVVFFFFTGRDIML